LSLESKDNIGLWSTASSIPRYSQQKNLAP
jgi:hypothetical protein